MKRGAIHFSMHGVKVDAIEKELNTVAKHAMTSDAEIKERVAKGDALVMEKADCMAQYL
jgi:hypothetical protein